MQKNNNSLTHFGILGMHWGRRKARLVATSSSGGGSSKGKDSADDTPESSSDDHKKVKELRKKKVSELSNAEMQAVITRANLEKQFSEVNKKQVNAGQKFVTDMLLNSGKQIATEYVNSQMKRGFSKIVKNP